VSNTFFEWQLLIFLIAKRFAGISSGPDNHSDSIHREENSSDQAEAIRRSFPGEVRIAALVAALPRRLLGSQHEFTRSSE
jgi:hypothetical protein